MKERIVIGLIVVESFVGIFLLAYGVEIFRGRDTSTNVECIITITPGAADIDFWSKFYLSNDRNLI